MEISHNHSLNYILIIKVWGSEITKVVKSLLVGSGDRDYTHGEVEAIHLTDVIEVLVTPPVEPELGQSGGHCSPLLAPYSASYKEK